MWGKRTLGVLGGLLISLSPALAGFAGFIPDGNGAAFPAAANGRKTDVPFIEATALGDRPITVDGKLSEEAWRESNAACGFRVWDPDRGAVPAEETVFKVLYDEDAVYFGVACLEDDPSNISASLSRRDSYTKSDIVSIYIDPYHDKTTGYNFRVNPVGVQMDGYMFNDGDRDDDWDAVWQAETYRDDQGWYAEVRIPFSSVRYRPADTMTWGLNVYRYMHGRGQETAWTTWDRETRGFISRFGELRGLKNVPPPRQIEVLPYFVQRTTNPALEPGSPVPDEMDNFQDLGADLKYGVTADLTLNATFQPDFGQVEADPAVLNLSPFETFFSEKRPFFIEGSRFFQHPNFNLFYSRRIGTGDENSRIRGAAKLTGKTAGDVSVAALYAVTDIAPNGRAHNPFVKGEQVNHYFVGRFGKEFNDGNYKFNVMQTAVLKTAERAEVGDFDSREAYTSGVDFDLNFDNRNYNVQGSVVGSFVNSEELPDDPSAGEQVNGHGGSIEVRKLGGTLQGGTWFNWEQDKLLLNDMGFLSSPDEFGTGLWGSYRYNPEGKSKLFNRGNLNFNYWKSWIYAARTGLDEGTGEEVWFYGGGHPQYSGMNVNGWMQLRNYWEGWAGVEYMFEGTHRYETRGGPLMKEPTTFGGWWGLLTDSRKDVVFELDGSYYADVKKNWSAYVAFEAEWNQSTAIDHSVRLGFRHRVDDTQYLGTFRVDENPGTVGIGGLSYVFGRIDQKTLDVTLRTNVLFSRDLSLEVYAQPFLAVGDYTNGKELARPDSYEFFPYEADGFAVADNDFSFASVNVNVVGRWQYMPGSTLFLVWTHSRSDYEERGFYSSPDGFSNNLDTGNLFSTEPENVFLAKLTYWFAL